MQTAFVATPERDFWENKLGYMLENLRILGYRCDIMDY